MSTTCPNYNDPITVQQFNSIVESFGGKALSLDEFESKELRRQRETVDRFAMDAAYYLWDKYLGNIDDINYDDDAIEYRKNEEMKDSEELSTESVQEPSTVDFTTINLEQYSLRKQNLPDITSSENIAKDNVEEIQSKVDTKKPTKTQLKTELGFYGDKSVEGIKLLKIRVKRYNIKNNTSHGVDVKKIAERNSFATDIILDFSPRTGIAAEKFAEVQSEEGKVISELKVKMNINTLKTRNRIRPGLVETWGEEFVDNAVNNFDEIFSKYAESIVTEAERWVFIKKYLDGEFKILC